MSLNKAGKILAVFSALVLGGGFVAYRQMEQSESPPHPKNDVSLPSEEPTSENSDPVTILPSSKSITMPVFSKRKLAPEESTHPETPIEKEMKRAVLPSSKSFTIIRPEDAATISPVTIDAIFDGQDVKPTEEIPPP